MKVVRSERGFERIVHDSYANEPVPDCTLVGASSAIGNYEDSWDRPGSSFLWIGNTDHAMHINRDEVRELIVHLQSWVESGNLAIETQEQP